MIWKLRPKKIKKQESLFVEALQEAGFVIKPGSVSIDHPTAQCFHETNVYPLLFPLRYLRESRSLQHHKTLEFCFRGLHTPKRNWVNHYGGARSSIVFTDQGRNISKELFDHMYYQEMASSKFTLCPAGDFKWTYRFLEAILCRSIPVIEVGSENPHCDDFIYFTSADEPNTLLPRWSEEIVAANYSLFLKRHTLLSKFIFI